MTDDTTGLIEADITINGRALTFGESMTLRVAIGSFRLSLRRTDMRSGLGPQLADHYDRHSAAIERAILALHEPRKAAAPCSRRTTTAISTIHTTTKIRTVTAATIADSSSSASMICAEV